MNHLTREKMTKALQSEAAVRCWLLDIRTIATELDDYKLTMHQLVSTISMRALTECFPSYTKDLTIRL